MNARPHPTKPKTYVVKFWYQKRHYKKTVPATNSREAEAFGWKWRAQIADGTWNPKALGPKDILFCDATERFIEDYSKPRKKSACADLVLRRRCEEFFSGKTLSQISPLMVEQFRAWLGNQTYKDTLLGPEKPLSPMTVNRHHEFAKAVANKMRLWRLYEGENPFSRVKLEDESKFQRQGYLEKDTYDKLLAVAAPSIRPIIVVGAHLGLRPGEMKKLTKEDVNLDACTIGLPDPKSGEREWVPVGATVYEAIAPLVRICKGPKDRVFDFTGFDKRWKRARKAAGITHLVFYEATRHTAGAWITRTSGGLGATQKFLRHRDPKTTMRYAHFAPGYLREVALKMDQALGTASADSDTVSAASVVRAQSQWHEVPHATGF